MDIREFTVKKDVTFSDMVDYVKRSGMYATREKWRRDAEIPPYYKPPYVTFCNGSTIGSALGGIRDCEGIYLIVFGNGKVYELEDNLTIEDMTARDWRILQAVDVEDIEVVFKQIR